VALFTELQSQLFIGITIFSRIFIVDTEKIIVEITRLTRLTLF
jgi:hypothetical protein